MSVRMPPKSLRLLGLIVFPVVVAVCGMLWSSATMLTGIAQSVDSQEADRSWHAIKSALSAAEERLSGTVADNARWDDAASHAYGPIDQSWMYNTWGFATSDVNFDTFYVVDSQGRSIASYQNGYLSTLPATDFFGEALKKIIDELPKDSSTFEAISTLVMTPQGLSIMAAGPILPTSEEARIPTERPNVLVFSKLVSDDMLAAMSEQYVVDGIKLATVTQTAEASNILLDRWGRVLSSVTWQARHPGAAASAAYQGNALLSILAIIGVMLPLTSAYASSVHAIDRTAASARHAADHDALSGLYNRAFLIGELTSNLATARPLELALVFVDLDGFKAVNDAYDHETGDALIRTVAERLSSLTAGQCTLARLGGDEFAMLIKGPRCIERAQALAQRVLAELGKPFDIGGRIALIGASIGIAQRGDQQLEPPEFMRMADIAMYEAKNAGGNRMRLFDSALDEKRREDIAIANEMRAFIAQGVFDIAYQPMVDSRNRAVVGVEALARWPKSSDRRLAPDCFIRIAEEHGLINDLGSLILRMACRDMAQLPGLRLAVNVSALQVNDPELVSKIARIASETDFPLNRLEVEFTETVLIRNEQRADEVIAKLKSLGITISLDDFGTGYASVGYLHRYAFDKIKLDRSLTRSLRDSPATQRVVQGTILIAEGLSAHIIAEGVETEEEARLMQLSGCQELQGYFFGKPQSAAALISQFDQHVAYTQQLSA
jgi:diguanylate cyclase (GGDEF)-like protein